MKALFDEPVSQEGQSLWTKFKTFFFCDADESLHWTDCAWLLVGGLTVVMALAITLI